MVDDEGVEIEDAGLPSLAGRKLRLMLSTSRRGERTVLRLEVPVPATYDSPLVRKYRDRHLVEVHLDAYPARNTIHLAWFGVLAREFQGDSSEEEREAFRGVGRKVLCYGISVLAPMMRDPRTAVVELEAVGGQCPDESAYDAWKKSKLYYLIRKYENTYRSLKSAFAKNDMKTLRRTACMIEDNEKLVRYYNRYGLKATEFDNGYFVDMRGSLADVVRACQMDRSGSLTKAQREAIDAAVAKSLEEPPTKKRK
eukprot:jgi/Mesvir1/10949/Mv11490-RA.1